MSLPYREVKVRPKRFSPLRLPGARSNRSASSSTGVLRAASGKLRYRWRRKITTCRFQSGHFEASSASFDSQELRDALANYRDRNGFAPLVLRLSDTEGHEYHVSFSVLTPPNQKRLAQELAEWDAKDGLVRHLGRASVYFDFGLYSEAAAESELALKESPKSSLLLQLTANAERRTGNLPRASELEGELKQMSAKVQ